MVKATRPFGNAAAMVRECNSKKYMVRERSSKKYMYISGNATKKVEERKSEYQDSVSPQPSFAKQPLLHRLGLWSQPNDPQHG